LAAISVGIRYVNRYVQSEYLKYRDFTITDVGRTLGDENEYLDEGFKPIAEQIGLYGQIDSSNEYQSEYATGVLRLLPSVAQFVKSKSFASFYDLCGYLLLEGRKDLEFKCLKTFTETYILDTTNYSGLGHYLDYLKKYYQEPMENLLARKQFEEAHQLSTEMINRLQLIDLPPLSLVSAVHKSEINTMYLLNILQTNVSESVRGEKSIDSLVDLCRTDWRIEKLDAEEKYGTEAFGEFIRYLAGVGKFQNRNYRGAIEIFDSVISETNVPLLKSLAAIMVVRCVIWEYVSTGKKDASASLRAFDSYTPFISVKNLTSDADYYRQFLRGEIIAPRKDRSVSRTLNDSQGFWLSKTDIVRLKKEIIEAVIKQLKHHKR
jgi:hypothetical protein